MTFIIYLLLILGSASYTSARIWALFPLPSMLKLLVIGVYSLALLSLPAYFFWGKAWSIEQTRWVYRIGTTMIIIHLYVFMSLLIVHILGTLPFLIPYTRHSWWGMLIVLIGLVAIFIYGNNRYHRKVRVPLNIEVDKLLKRPLKIVALSDMHLGYTIGKDELSRWIDTILAERPELILIAGDIVDGQTRPLVEDEVYQELSRLQAPLGVYACLGNHEYIDGELNSEKFLARTNIHLLRDSVVSLGDNLYIIGRDDQTNPQRKALSELTHGLDTSRTLILLDHQPYHLEEAETCGIDLQLSGHTHQGQVFPINLVVDRMYEHAHGYYRKGKTHYYVSSGIGIWGGKFRIGTQSEYIVINLESTSR